MTLVGAMRAFFDDSAVRAEHSHQEYAEARSVEPSPDSIAACFFPTSSSVWWIAQRESFSVLF
jgi:hypothetical protein